MPVVIVASRRDLAAQNIAQHLIRNHDFRPVSDNLFRSGNIFVEYVDSDSVHTTNLALDFKPEAVIFASRHRSERGDPTLTVHWPGNPTSSADLGGSAKTLCLTEPSRLRAALLALDEARETSKLNYAVTMEATHHGPTELGVPTLFVEIGSSEEQWNDLEAAACAAQGVWIAATSPCKGKPAVGFGGGHYCNKHSLAIRKDDYAFSHVLSKYFFDEYDEDIVRMAFERTLGGCRTAVIDWKGVRGSDRVELLQTLNRMNIEIVRL